jgi:hypothetical protein
MSDIQNNASSDSDPRVAPCEVMTTSPETPLVAQALT